jgi:outer membrane autotransporter protein
LGFDLTTQGVVDQDATADYDGKMLTLSLSSGYDFAVNGWTLGPRGSLDYIKTKVDGFAETLSNPTSDGGGWASFINETDQKWLTLRLGGKASYALSTNWGVLSPYAGIDWLHEFKNDSQIITGGLLEDPGSTLFSVYTDEPDRNYFQLNLGVSAVFKNGLIGYLNYDTILANDRWDRQSVNLGIRKEF